MDKLRKIIKEELKSFISNNINEYLDKDHDIPLKNYLSMSDNEKETDILYSFPYLLFNFFNELMENGQLSDEEAEIVKNSDEDGEYLVDEVINGGLNGYYKDALKYIQSNADYYDFPAHQTFDEAIPIKNEWLIHFTNDALSIAREGFKYGTEFLDRLHFTNAGHIEGKGKGYDFAYTVRDYDRFYRGYNGNPKYGNEAVLFRASGIKTWHYGDEEYQVIFWGNNAKDIIPIQQNYDGDWTVFSDKTGRELVKFDKLEDIVNWVLNNKEQYRKHMDYRRR